MSTCIAIVSELIFATRISATAKKVGTECTMISDLTALQGALQASAPKVVIVDMNCDGMLPAEAIRMVKSCCPTARVVAFCSHVQTELMEQAQAAGADDTWPRSTFVQQLPKLLQAACD